MKSKTEPRDVLAGEARCAVNVQTTVMPVNFDVPGCGRCSQDYCCPLVEVVKQRDALAAALAGIFAQTEKHSRAWGQVAGAAAFARDPDTAKAFAAARAALKGGTA